MEDRADASFVIYKPAFFTLKGYKFGFEFSRVGLGETPYLDRYIAYLGGPTLRLHKFWRGDDDRAPHDHPWAFWTMPFRTYKEIEEYPMETARGTSYLRRRNIVKAFRIHRRPAKYRHIVLGAKKPFWTLVVTGPVTNKWGFWPQSWKFIPWREWPRYVRELML